MTPRYGENKSLFSISIHLIKKIEGKVETNYLCFEHMLSLTHFIQMFPFIPPEKIREFLVF